MKNLVKKIVSVFQLMVSDLDSVVHVSAFDVAIVDVNLLFAVMYQKRSTIEHDHDLVEVVVLVMILILVVVDVVVVALVVAVMSATAMAPMSVVVHALNVLLFQLLEFLHFL